MPCFNLLVETWPPSLKPVSLVNQHWSQTEAWPQALCVQLGCVPASWLSHKASAPTPGRGFLPISFLQREPYFESTQNSLVHICVIGMSLLTIFFLLCFFEREMVHLRFYSNIFNWIAPCFFPTNLNLRK